jgi:hypothetical protein
MGEEADFGRDLLKKELWPQKDGEPFRTTSVSLILMRSCGHWLRPSVSQCRQTVCAQVDPELSSRCRVVGAPEK